MKNIIKYFNLFLILLLLFSFLYLIFSFIYNNISRSVITADFDSIRLNNEIYDSTDLKIIRTNEFKRIFNKIFSMKIDCSLYGKNCFNNEKLLNKIDENINALYSELNDIHEFNDIRSRTFLIIKEMYDNNINVFDGFVPRLDFIFLNEIIVICACAISIIPIFIYLISKVKWLKYNGISLILVSTFVLTSVYVTKIISFTYGISSSQFIFVFIVNSLLDISNKICIIYFIFGVISLLFYMFLKDRQKK